MLSITKCLCGWILLGDNALNKAQVNEAGQASLHISRAWPIINSPQQNTAAREKDTLVEMDKRSGPYWKLLHHLWQKKNVIISILLLPKYLCKGNANYCSIKCS